MMSNISQGSVATRLRRGKVFSDNFGCFPRCLSVSVSNYVQKTSERICMKFSQKVSNGPVNND